MAILKISGPNEIAFVKSIQAQASMAKDVVLEIIDDRPSLFMAPSAASERRFRNSHVRIVLLDQRRLPTIPAPLQDWQTRCKDFLVRGALWEHFSSLLTLYYVWAATNQIIKGADLEKLVNEWAPSWEEPLNARGLISSARNRIYVLGGTYADDPPDPKTAKSKAAYRTANKKHQELRKHAIAGDSRVAEPGEQLEAMIQHITGAPDAAAFGQWLEENHPSVREKTYKRRSDAGGGDDEDEETSEQKEGAEGVGPSTTFPG